MLLFGYNFGFWSPHGEYPKKDRPIDHINYEEKPLCDNLDIENKVFNYTRILMPERFDPYACGECIKIYLIKTNKITLEVPITLRLGL